MNIYVMLAIGLIPAIVVFVVMVRLLRNQAVNVTNELRSLHEKLDVQNSKIGELERKLSRVNQSVAKVADQSKELKQKTGERFKEEQEKLKEVHKEVQEVARKLTHLPQSTPPEKSDSEVGSKLDSPLVSEVMQMLEEGVDAQEIARIKGIQVGEIELIKGLKIFATKDGAMS